MFEFNNCRQEYFQRWNSQSREEFEKWFDTHCAKCPAMSEICMADVMEEKEAAQA